MRRLLLLVTLLLLGVSSVVAQPELVSGKTNRNKEPVNKNELTLREAFIIGSEKAKEWNKEAGLAFMNSVDEKKGGSRGFTGERYDWNLLFINPERTESLVLSISKGRITNFAPLKGKNEYDIVKPEDIKVDSPALVEIAKSKYNLKPGSDWASGYHFRLSIVNGQPCINVYGYAQEELTKLYFNAKDGQILLD